MRIINTEENGKTEMDPPDNVLYCGALKSLQKYASETFALLLSHSLVLQHDETL